MMVLLWCFIIGSFFLSWGWLVWSRIKGRRPWFPKQNPLRRAKWQFPEVLVIFGLFLFLPLVLIEIFSFTQSETVLAELRGILPAESVEEGELQTQHPLQEYLTRDGSASRYVFGFFFAAILVPFTEEFLFRGILQGWLMAKEREKAYFMGTLRRERPWLGWRATLVVAFFFAFMHFRVGVASCPSVELLQYQFTMSTFADVLLIGISVALLWTIRGATWNDLGLDFTHWKSDIKLGAFAFCLVGFLTYLLQFLGTLALGQTIAADPLALFPISVTFGVLYWRTRRLLPSVVTHALLNGLSITMMMLGT